MKFQAPKNKSQIIPKSQAPMIQTRLEFDSLSIGICPSTRLRVVSLPNHLEFGFCYLGFNRLHYVNPKLSDFPPAIIVYAGQFSGGDKPRPYLLGDTSFVVAGFIPADKGRNVEKTAQFR